MARSLSEIYAVAKECRNNYLELTEFNNSSKMSVLDAFTWVTSACVWAFENVLDVFKVDLARDLQNRINGTPAYFANALLKYQSGDNLVVNDDGTAFSYANTDPSKRIIKKVSYAEVSEHGFNDKMLVLKVATGQPGAYEQISEDEMIGVRAYLGQILFAGQHAQVVSRKGDVLIPRVTVYYDGAVTAEEVMSNIKKSLNDYIERLDFDGVVYAQKIIDCIQNTEHVTDVSISDDITDQQGIFVAQYDDDNNIIEINGTKEQRVSRYFIPNSGYIKESTGRDEEESLPNWSSAITLILEDRI